jgi:anti-sigma regulatory factor (Ser/Thr protein kinase)
MQMSGTDATISECYPARPDSVPRARAALSAFAVAAGLTGERLEDLRLAVSEAVTNAVQHAYGGDAGDIYVTAAVASGELWILIADDGRGLRGGTGDLPGLGLGLRCMATFSDSLTLVRRSSGGLEVRLRFRLYSETSVADADDLGAWVLSLS